MDIEIPNAIHEKRREITLGIIVVVLILLLILFLSAFSQTKALELSFTKHRIKPNEATKLIVEVRNNLGHDASNVSIEVVPESDVLLIPNNKHIEPTIGDGAYRRIEFNVMTKPDLLEGTYKITVKLEMDEKIEEASIYLEII